LVKQKLGILGGGQLARMMLPHCLTWDIEVSILDKANAVGRPFCSSFITGSFSSPEDVFEKFKTMDVVTMDLEAVSIEGLKKLESYGVKVYPSSHVIETIQNKGKQKEFFKKNNIPTMDFKILKKVDSSLTPGFLKKLEGGYDGKGVFEFQGDFKTIPQDFQSEVLWEKACDVLVEYSLIVARNSTGEIKTYDCTEMVFNPDLNLIAYTLYPARLTPSENKKAKEIASTIVEKMDAVGVFAVEFLKSKSGELLVNECAPRPHNSGHHTIESCETDQFANHLRGVLNYPLGSTKRVVHALTFNVIGKGEGEAVWSGIGAVMATEGAYLHNYGKKDCRSGRKMGHVTITGESYDSILQKYEYLVNKVKVDGKEESK